MRKIKTACLFLLSAFQVTVAVSQETFPVNGVTDKRNAAYAFTNATIVTDAKNVLQNSTLVIKDGKIIAVGAKVNIPTDALVIDCKGKYIYPSFIDIYSDYGVTVPQRQGPAFTFGAPAQLTSNTKGAYGWNQAIRPEV